MIIPVISSTGTARTMLAAFDRALFSVGVANYNLIRLSSVIPPSSKVKIVNRLTQTHGQWGDRLYVVMAEHRTEKPGDQVWAGVGWVQEATSGQGLFVEHEGNSKKLVEQQIRKSLKSLMETREVDYGDIHMTVTGIKCTATPVCALVIAVYGHEPWNQEQAIAEEK